MLLMLEHLFFGKGPGRRLSINKTKLSIEKKMKYGLAKEYTKRSSSEDCCQILPCSCFFNYLLVSGLYEPTKLDPVREVVFVVNGNSSPGL